VQEQRADRCVGGEPWQRESRILAQDSCPGAQAEPRKALIDERCPLASHFEAEQTHRGRRAGSLDEERPPARTDLDFDGTRAWEQSVQIDGRALGQPLGVRIAETRVGSRDHGSGRGTMPQAAR
jgi:hypothetical protein